MSGQDLTGPGRGAVPPSVERAAQLLFVSGGITLLSAAYLLLIASLPPLKLLLALLVLVLGGYQIKIGAQLLALEPAARSAAFVLAGAVCTMSLVAPGRSLVGTAIAVAVNAGIVFFLHRPDAKSAGRRAGARP